MPTGNKERWCNQYRLNNCTSRSSIVNCQPPEVAARDRKLVLDRPAKQQAEDQNAYRRSLGYMTNNLVVAKLPVLEQMLSIYINQYGISDEKAPLDIDLEITREKLLGFLQDSGLRNMLINDSGEVLRITTYTIRKQLLQMSAGLDLAVACCRYQQYPLRKVLWTDALYGLELQNLALRHDEYYVKKHPLSHQRSWLTLLEDGAIRGAIFCGGLAAQACSDHIHNTGLSMAGRTGSPVFHTLWSYVLTFC